MRKRLDAIAIRFNPVQSGVVFFPLRGETDEEMDKRIARWYAGEKVEGQDKVYTGGVVGRIRFLRGKS